MSTYSKQKLPSNGTKVRIGLNIVSKVCGTNLFGYYAGADADFLYLSHAPVATQTHRVGWSLIVEIEDSTVQHTCLEI